MTDRRVGRAAARPFVVSRSFQAGLAAAVLLLAGAHAVLAHDGGPRLTLEPARVHPGGVVVVRGEDLGADQEMRIALVGEGTQAGLTNGATYTFTVTATNGVGPGRVSDPSAAVTPMAVTVPDAPTTVVAAAGDGSAAASWLAPANDGGAAISGYAVTPHDLTANSDGAPVPASGTNAMVGGLANGHSYTFTVKATNAVGPGPASAASAAVTPVAGAQAATTTIPPGSGGSTSTDPGGTGPTPADPLTTSVAVPPTANGGSVTITETAATGSPPAGGYQFLGQQVDIVSTAATSETNPPMIVFAIDASAIRSAFALGPTDPLPDAAAVDITRAEGDGSPSVIATCTSTGGETPIAPTPACVASRTYLNDGGYLEVTVLSASASRWTSVVKPVGVTVLDKRYDPTNVTLTQGSVVLWTFGGAKKHTVTESGGLGPSKTPLFASAALVSGRFGWAFRAAGTYAYGSTVKGDPPGLSGHIGVPVVLSPASGATTTTFTVRWATSAMTGYVFDVRYRFQKAGTKGWTGWVNWLSGQTAPSADFIPGKGHGTYSFDARLRNAATGKASDWSPETMIFAQ